MNLQYFRTPEYGLEKELQELVAIREATDPKFVPVRLRKRHAGPYQTARLEQRIDELTALLGR